MDVDAEFVTQHTHTLVSTESDFFNPCNYDHILALFTLLRGSYDSGHIFDPTDLPMLLKQYYARCFPFEKYFQWLSYELPLESYFQRREFSFTLKDDVYVRYQCFQNRAELEKGG